MKASEVKLIMKAMASSKENSWWETYSEILFLNIKNRAEEGETNVKIDYVPDHQLRAKLNKELFALGYDVVMVDECTNSVKSIAKIQISWGM